MQIRQLETDKARLMDRVEELTGEPLGDLPAPIDLLPPSLDVLIPSGDGVRKLDASLDERRALGSIVRIAADTRRSAAALLLTTRAKPEPTATPQAALAGVRRMRSERDALRRRLLELLPQVSDASKYSGACKELAQVAAAIDAMEQFVGGAISEVAKGALLQVARPTWRCTFQQAARSPSDTWSRFANLLGP